MALILGFLQSDFTGKDCEIEFGLFMKSCPALFLADNRGNWLSA